MPYGNTPIEEALHILANAGHADDETGQVDGPDGLISLFIISTRVEALVCLGLVNESAEGSMVDLSALRVTELVGNFILRTNEQGQVFLYEFESQTDAREQFDAYHTTYIDWI